METNQQNINIFVKCQTNNRLLTYLSLDLNGFAQKLSRKQFDVWVNKQNTIVSVKYQIYQSVIDIFVTF